MKKAIILCTFGIVLLLSGCGNQSVKMDYISAETARNVAFKEAGISVEEVTSSVTGLESRNGVDYYGVKFVSDGKEYEYDVDAHTGIVIEKSAVSENISNTANVISSSQPEQMISEEKAREIALTHAGLTADQVTFIKSGLDREDGRLTYDIEFYTGDYKEYDYEIDPYTGNVLSYDYDAEYYNAPVPSGQISNSAAASSGTSANTISEEKAKEIALTHAGLTADQVIFIKCGLDWDDGRMTYDIEFYTGDYKEYDYEIDPYTGNVLSYDYDAEYYSAPVPSGQISNSAAASSGTSASTISEEKAKEIALAQVPGATSKDIWEFEIDYDDGRLQYEGKIYYDYMEYEFEIDGYSGAIRDWDVESIYD